MHSTISIHDIVSCEDVRREDEGLDDQKQCGEERKR